MTHSHMCFMFCNRTRKIARIPIFFSFIIIIILFFCRGVISLAAWAPRLPTCKCNYCHYWLIFHTEHSESRARTRCSPHAVTANYTCKNPFNEGLHGTYIRTEAPPLMQVAPHLAGFVLLLSQTAAANGTYSFQKLPSILLRGHTEATFFFFYDSSAFTLLFYFFLPTCQLLGLIRRLFQTCYQPYSNSTYRDGNFQTTPLVLVFSAVRHN